MLYRLLSMLFALAMGVLPWHVQAQTQIVVPFPAGGGTDLVARQIQNALSRELNAPVVVVNASGASGAIGAQRVLSARPDGTSLLLTSLAPVVIQPSIPGSVRYKTNDFAPVCLLTNPPIALMTPPASGLRSMSDLVARARSSPHPLPYASSGIGGVGHLATLALLKAAGIEMQQIPYRGAADALQAMHQGSVLFFPAEPSIAKQYQLNTIGVFGEQRTEEMPDAATMREQGYDLSFRLWVAIFASSATPEPVLAKLATACEHAMSTPSVLEAMQRSGQPVRFMGRAEFTRFVESETARYAKIVGDAKIDAGK